MQLVEHIVLKLSSIFSHSIIFITQRTNIVNIGNLGRNWQGLPEKMVWQHKDSGGLNTIEKVKSAIITEALCPNSQSVLQRAHEKYPSYSQEPKKNKM